MPFIGCPWVAFAFTLKKLECSKRALDSSDTRTWNNGIGPWVISVGLWPLGND